MSLLGIPCYGSKKAGPGDLNLLTVSFARSRLTAAKVSGSFSCEPEYLMLSLVAWQQAAFQALAVHAFAPVLTITGLSRDSLLIRYCQ